MRVKKFVIALYDHPPWYYAMMLVYTVYNELINLIAVYQIVQIDY